MTTEHVKRLVTFVALVFAISSAMTSAEGKSCVTGVGGVAARHSSCGMGHLTAHEKQQQRQVTGSAPPAQPREPSGGGSEREDRGGRY
jgi:hypothetical protein